MRKRSGIMGGDFERVIDEFFDEMLITPWRCAGAEQFQRARVIEHRDRYELRIAIAGVDPHQIEVEMSGQRLWVRAPTGRGGRAEDVYSFAASIEAEKVVASWSHDTLVVVLPKVQPTRVKVEH